MRHVEPEVYLIAKSEISSENADEWLHDLGVSQAARIRLLDCMKTGAERIVEAAGRRCYKSFEPGLNPNVTRVREDVVAYIDNILQVGHGSVTEHATFTFAIENVSRVFTGEINRHRAGMAISEASMRYIRYTDIPYWVPTSIRMAGDDADEKRKQTQDIFDKAFKHAELCYAQLLEVWKDELAPESKFKAKKEITSMMRRIIPMGVATGGIWTGNIRALRNIFELRCSPAAEEEILLVANKMLAVMVQEEPSFFGDFARGEDGYFRPKYHKV